MNNFLKYCFLISIALFLGSCTSSKKNELTYFGGKIIHPKSDKVLLFKNEKVIDTLFLDKEDKFLGEYKNFDEGFYYFQHGPEHQYVFIQPKDSILIRLNTWDFDESLVFSGIGAEKNNILIDCFLESEKEVKNHNIYSFYALPPNEFKSKIDSLLYLREKKINDFRLKNENLPKEYNDVLDIVAKYPLYSRYENYISRNKYINKTPNFQNLDTSFYTYRDNINISNDSLMYLVPYSQYVVSRLYNEVHTKGFTSNSEDFTVTLLNTVNQNIIGENLKNTFLKEMVVNDFLDKSSCNIDKKVFSTYFKLSSSIEDKKQIQRLLNDVNSLHGGNQLPDFKVIDYTKKTHPISKLLKKKNSVIYIWNPRFINTDYLASRINFLSNQFPNLNFIGVKINTFNNLSPIKGIDIKKQFYINSDSEAHNFLTSKIPRTLLVNKKGVIVNGYASINRRKIMKQLKQLEKQ